MRRPNRTIRAGLMVAALWGLGSADSAEMHIDVDGPLELDLEAGRAWGEGEVRISHGELRVCCGRIAIDYEQERMTSLVCTERPVLRRGKNLTAEAQKILYDGSTIRLKGAVVVQTESATFFADTLEIDSRGQRVRMMGSPSRVRMHRGAHRPSELARPCPYP